MNIPKGQPGHSSKSPYPSSQQTRFDRPTRAALKHTFYGRIKMHSWTLFDSAVPQSAVDRSKWLEVYFVRSTRLLYLVSYKIVYAFILVRLFLYSMCNRASVSLAVTELLPQVQVNEVKLGEIWRNCISRLWFLKEVYSMVNGSTHCLQYRVN